jgi:rubrerythrin
MIEGENAMVSPEGVSPDGVWLEGTRTGANLKHAFSDEGQFNRLYLDQELAAETAGFPDLAKFSRAAAGSGARFASGHLDYLVAGNNRTTTSGMSRDGFAAEMTAIIDNRSAICAGMARTARDEGFEEIADWFETLAKAGRSHVRRMRRVSREREIKT